MKMATLAQIEKHGWTVERGAYIGTSDDRADRWYAVRIDAQMVDRRGNGFATKQAAIDEVALYLGL